MQVAQIVPPWIPVPPRDYGGTELAVAALIRGLQAQGVEVALFAARNSTLLPAQGPFSEGFWPPDKFSENLHLAYAFQRLQAHPPQVVHSHLENAAGFWAVGLPRVPLVVTLHTPLNPVKLEYLLSFPGLQIVVVSAFQARLLAGHPGLHLIHHGLPLADYPFANNKEDYFLFLGRIYPDKGLHTAIRLVQETGGRLVVAGPVFPPDQPYFETQIRPHLDGRAIRYVGPADFARKVELLGKARALVLPVEVEEAFGLAMLEAMACGTPVLAYGRGAVPEVVADGVSGFVVHDFEEMKRRLADLPRLDPRRCREHVQTHFSWEANVLAHLSLYRRLA
ncbi:MAG: glycosyltransferase family 4 protein [Deltaproteobacteria bacterium]|nr:glycosyltransferase family 4 protein [Deltaproteobacteria bacterium]